MLKRSDTNYARQIQEELDSQLLNERQQSRQAKDEEQNSCTICSDYLFEFDSATVLQTCGCVFHLSCLRPYFKVEVDKGNIEIKCPRSSIPQSSDACKEPLQHQDLNAVMDSDLYERWAQMSVTRAVDSADDMSWCPNPACGYAFVKDSNEHKCLKCLKHYCLDCRVDMHTGKTCDQFQRQYAQSQEAIIKKKEDDEVLEVLKNVIKAKQCKKCKFWVERSKGCNHMTCRCGYQFCYRCGLKYRHHKCKCKFFEPLMQ